MLAGDVVASVLLAIGELPRRVRFLVGESGTAEAAWGLDCVVKRSLMVFSECFRLSALEWADIGRRGVAGLEETSGDAAVMAELRAR